jgi:endonuclease/exonuclease/phosphatase family metal-dependent hydrolase
MKVQVLILASAMAVALAGCGDSGPSGELRAATYNAGLAPGFVDHTAARAPVTTAELAAHDFDVLCVQEFFVPAHWEALVQATSDRYVDTLYLEPMPDDEGDDEGDEDEPACTPEETDPLLECVQEHCSDVSDDELTDCALGACAEEVDALSGGCLACVAANLGQSIDAIITACGEGSASYAYEGSFGIGLLTVAPMADKDSIVMDSNLTRRGVLYGRMSDEVFGDLHLFCTHLSPVFSAVPFPGDGSWEQEQVDQIEALLAFVDAKVGEGEPVVVLGDLNTGPAAGGVAAEQPEHYARFEAAGFFNPYTQGDDAECTFCASNLLVGGGADHEDSGIIDHVLVRGVDLLEADHEASRFMTETIEIDIADVGTVTTQYSDHYGVSVNLSR